MEFFMKELMRMLYFQKVENYIIWKKKEKKKSAYMNS